MKKYIITLLLPFLLFSCEDYLSIDSPSNFDNSYVYSNEGEIFRALTAVYSPLTEVYGGRWITAFIPNTDVEFNAVDEVLSAKGDDFASFEPQSLNTDLTGVMTSFYKAINLANGVIAGIEGCELYANADKTQPSNLMQMYGEAKTLRAMVYLDLVRCWGDVPLMLKPSSSDDEMFVDVVDRDSILTYMINDLKSVEPTMMYAKDINYGVERANREFCQGLIALTALTRGGWSLRPNKENPADRGQMIRSSDWREYYKIAEEYAGKVINDGYHNLTMGFEEFWKMVCNLGTVTNDDFIFDIPLLKSSGTGEYCYYVGVPMDSDNGTGTNPYGKSSGSYNLTTLYMLSFDEDDLRRDVTCVNYSYDAQLNQKGPTIGDNNLGRIKDGKYRRIWMETPLGSTTTKSTGVNASYMRYADILLMYAEAANENNNGPTQGAKDALKQVRKRAFPSDKWAEKVDAYVDALTTKDKFFEAIVNERKWEFGGENKRHYDLARWNIYGQVLVDFYKNAVQMGYNANFPTTQYLQWSNIPDNYYYRQVNNPERPGTLMLEFVGLHKREKEPAEGKYTRKGFATGFIVQKTDAAGNKLDKSDPANWEPCPTLKRCFRGYFTDQTIDMIDPEKDPVPYLLPFGQTFISANPKIKNYYGFK